MGDKFFMKRCLELAELGIGYVSPNPMVGCVIVVDDLIIGEGYHHKYGSQHAEPTAVQAVFYQYADQAVDLLMRATVYVNLEPCAHFGKTPPCADLLIKHKVKKVVIANIDPFDGVDGKGIAKLKKAGIEVVTGILEEEAYFLNRRFFTRVTKQRPYIILKWAETKNGFMANKEKKQQWISGALAKQLSHKWRIEEDAILIGKNTALIDNPTLTARDWPGKNPIRVLIDKNLEIPLTNNLFNIEAKTIVFNALKSDVENNVNYIQMEDMHFYLPQKIAFQLYLMDVQSIIIEGGANILSQFIDAGIWDEARLFISESTWESGIKAPIINVNLMEQIPLNSDTLNIYINNTN